MKINQIESIIRLYEDNACIETMSLMTGCTNQQCEDVVDVYDYMERKIYNIKDCYEAKLVQKDVEISELKKELADFYKAVAKRFVYGEDANASTVSCDKSCFEIPRMTDNESETY
jgi:hypothetical protein